MACVLRAGGRSAELCSPDEKRCFALLRRLPTHSTTSDTVADDASSLLQIHAFLLCRGALDANLSLLTRLISAFSDLAASAASSSLLRHACSLFDRRVTQDAVLCNSMLRALVRHRRFREAVVLYRDLLREEDRTPRFAPDGYTFPFLLKSCAALPGDASEGPQLHAHVIKMGFCYHAFSSTGLVDVYSKRKDMVSAKKLFDEMPHRSLASWTSIAVGYARAGDASAAMESFEAMPEKDVAASNAMIDVFVKMGDVPSARRLFDEMHERNVVSWTSLISGYCRVGDMDAARSLFDEMPQRNLYSWNVMIGGYSQNRQSHLALELFRELQWSSSSLKPDDVTLVSVLPAVTDIGAIDVGRWIHNYARRNNLDQEITVSTAFVDMYAKCGDVCEARRVFDKMPSKETATWNAMINGLAVNGRAEEALDVFAEMLRRGAHPNNITMIGVLSACNHGGLVEEGRRWFGEMEALRIDRKIEHYGCMVDLLGRRGHLEEAEKLMEEMPWDANGILLSSLLAACECYGDVERAERVMKRASVVEPGNLNNFIIMRNLYARAKQWRDVEKIKDTARGFGGKREAGCSVIEVSSRVSEFVSGDRAHPESQMIYTLLEHLQLDMKGQEETELDSVGPCEDASI